MPKKKTPANKPKAINGLAKPPKPNGVGKITSQVRAEKLAKKIGDKLRVNFITGRTQAEKISYLSTGHQVLDDAISGERTEDQEVIEGTGQGFPRGRIVEVYGREASAKTSLGLSVIAEAQRRGELAAFIDVEHALNDVFAAKLFGVDMASLLWIQPEDGEEALEVLHALVDNKVSVIVLDSVAALVSRSEAGGGKAMGEQARLMSSVCRKLTTKLKPGGPCVIFINQVRMKIGVMFGNPETTSGGLALSFYSSVRINLRKKKDIKKTGKVKGVPKVVGMRMAMKVVKNKIAPMGGYAEFNLSFSKGIEFGKMPTQEEEDDD